MSCSSVLQCSLCLNYTVLENACNYIACSRSLLYLECRCLACRCLMGVPVTFFDSLDIGNMTHVSATCITLHSGHKFCAVSQHHCCGFQQARLAIKLDLVTLPQVALTHHSTVPVLQGDTSEQRESRCGSVNRLKQPRLFPSLWLLGSVDRAIPTFPFFRGATHKYQDGAVVCTGHLGEFWSSSS